jgi:hypothetical protein
MEWERTIKTCREAASWVLDYSLDIELEPDILPRIVFYPRIRPAK